MTAATKPVTRAETLALITARGRMTRHDLTVATGCSQRSADQMFAILHELEQIKPCGHERTPGRRTWRMQFCATSQGEK